MVIRALIDRPKRIDVPLGTWVIWEPCSHRTPRTEFSTRCTRPSRFSGGKGSGRQGNSGRRSGNTGATAPLALAHPANSAVVPPDSCPVRTGDRWCDFVSERFGKRNGSVGSVGRILTGHADKINQPPVAQGSVSVPDPGTTRPDS